MGFFSWDCKSCNHPALCSMATEADNAWMNKVVALTPNGSVIIGEYDGYGRIYGDDGSENELHGEPELWHYACWVKAGKPAYSGPSDRSDDQGWFFDDGDHDMAEPSIPD